MTYVDGFLAPVKTTDKETYLEFAKSCVPVFKKHGALRLIENWGDDVPEGKVTSMPMAVKLEDDETLVFSWVFWPSKEARDQGWKKLEEDPFFAEGGPKPPFDGKRMIFGGFTTIMDE